MKVEFDEIMILEFHNFLKSFIGVFFLKLTLHNGYFDLMRLINSIFLFSPITPKILIY